MEVGSNFVGLFIMYITNFVGWLTLKDHFFDFLKLLDQGDHGRSAGWSLCGLNGHRKFNTSPKDNKNLWFCIKFPLISSDRSQEKGNHGFWSLYENISTIHKRIISYLFQVFDRSVQHFVLALKLVPHSTVLNVRLNDRIISYNFIFYLPIYCGFSLESSSLVILVGVGSHSAG